MLMDDYQNNILEKYEIWDFSRLEKSLKDELKLLKMFLKAGDKNSKRLLNSSSDVLKNIILLFGHTGFNLDVIAQNSLK